MVSQPPTQRIALVLQYLGNRFHGWQWQPRQRTVQQELEDAIQSVLDCPVRVHAAGRTDTGVHAAAQIVHFDAQTLIPAHRWRDVLNARLPDDMLVRASAQVDSRWHARFSATWRRYRYTLYTDACPNLFVRSLAWHYYQAPLDESRMRAALEPLLGRHHLAAFHRAGSSRPHSWVDVQDVVCDRDGPFLYIEVQASGFLYGMMRLLVGMLVDVGQGALSPEDFTALWQDQRRDEVKYAAPPQGLCLLRVGYPTSPFPLETWYDAQPHLALPKAPESLESLLCLPRV